MKRFTSFLVVMFVFAAATFAQSAQVSGQGFDHTRLDQYFDALEANDKFMGSVAVSRNGELIYTRSLGYADLAQQQKADASTKYRIGSISKTFTAVLVMKAIEEGKLDFNQTLDHYFPTIKNADRITIEQLLYHRSGIHSFTDDPDYLTWNTEAKSEEEMVARIAASDSDFEPDSRSAYSNSNYVLLTYILEKSFQRPYAELVKSLIADKIGLKDTYLGRKINSADREAQSYQYTGKWDLSPETHPSVPLGAGALVSTPSDLVRFSDALFNGDLISQESLKRMQTIKGGFGIGLFQIPFYEYVGLGHTGGIDGFSSVFAHFENGNISYALTSNGTIFNNNDISIAVLSALYNKPYDIPVFSGYEPDAEYLSGYVGSYSSPMIPLKITITIENGNLMAQATGQPAFPLEAVEKHKFKFDVAGVVIDFIPTENALILKQGGGQFRFVKE